MSMGILSPMVSPVGRRGRWSGCAGLAAPDWPRPGRSLFFGRRELRAAGRTTIRTRWLSLFRPSPAHRPFSNSGGAFVVHELGVVDGCVVLWFVSGEVILVVSQRIMHIGFSMPAIYEYSASSWRSCFRQVSVRAHSALHHGRSTCGETKISRAW